MCWYVSLRCWCCLFSCFLVSCRKVKRDRCVCETCGVEIAGWRPWNNPWQMHNLARHPKDFLNTVLAAAKQYAQIDTFNYLYPESANPSANPNANANASAVVPAPGVSAAAAAAGAPPLRTEQKEREGKAQSQSPSQTPFYGSGPQAHGTAPTTAALPHGGVRVATPASNPTSNPASTMALMSQTPIVHSAEASALPVVSGGTRTVSLPPPPHSRRT
jgi:hypothetical protein